MLNRGYLVRLSGLWSKIIYYIINISMEYLKCITMLDIHNQERLSANNPKYFLIQQKNDRHQKGCVLFLLFYAAYFFLGFVIFFYFYSFHCFGSFCSRGVIYFSVVPISKLCLALLKNMPLLLWFLSIFAFTVHRFGI